MVLRGLAAVSLLTTGGSAFTNISRPLVSTVLAICAFAVGAKLLALKAKAASAMLAALFMRCVPRFVILPRGRLCNGDANSVQRYSTWLGCAIVVFGAAYPFRDAK